MPLPSQSARVGPASRAYAYSKGRRRTPPGLVYVAIGIGVIAAAGVGYLAYRVFANAPENNLAAAGASLRIDDPIGGTTGTPEDGRGEDRTGATPAAASDSSSVPASGSDRTGSSPPASTTPEPSDPVTPPTITMGGGSTDATETPDPAPAQARDQPFDRAPARTAAPAPEPGATGESASGAEASDPEPGVSPGSARGVAPRALETAEREIDRGRPVVARRVLSNALADPAATASDRAVLRREATALNNSLVLGPNAHPEDPITETYTIEPGDSLSRIAARQDLGTHWKLIQRVNGIQNPSRIRVGQTLKLVRGPFHAVVRKGSYRLDLYHGPADRREDWIYIRSFNVGLGEGDSTPIGSFVVGEGSKLENPAWVNPRDGTERYGRNDPDNPVGEFWIGLEGLGDDAIYTGYGLHGTIEPDTIGTQASMGCVRMLPGDIELLYEMLGEGESLVVIER